MHDSPAHDGGFESLAHDCCDGDGHGDGYTPGLRPSTCGPQAAGPCPPSQAAGPCPPSQAQAPVTVAVSVSRARVPVWQRPAAGPAGSRRRTGRTLGGLCPWQAEPDTRSPATSLPKSFKISWPPGSRQPEPPSQPLQRRQRPGPPRLDSSSSFEFRQPKPHDSESLAQTG